MLRQARGLGCNQPSWGVQIMSKQRGGWMLLGFGLPVDRPLSGGAGAQ
jgi:hypothetical protein